MAKKNAAKRDRRRSAESAVPQDASPAATVIEAHLDVSGAATLREDLLQAMERGAVRIDLSEGQPTQPALQLLVAARNSAKSGHDVTFANGAAAVLRTMIEEDV